MKPAPANTRILKALLLFTLLANFSWQPALRSMNLSSSETVGSNADAPVTPVEPPTAPAASPAKPPAAPAPAPDAQVDHSPRVELPKICGIRFYVKYKEVAMEDQTLRTLVTVELHSGDISSFKTIPLTFRGSLSTNFDNSDLKKENDNTIAVAVKRHLRSCADDEAQPQSTKNSDDKEQAKKDKEDLKTGMAACRLNSKGDPLTEVEQTRCQLRKLNDLDNANADDYNSRQKVMTKIEQLVNGNIRKSIKNRLMSKDDSKVDEGEQLLQETLDTVNDLTTTLGLDSYRMSRIKLGLESLRAGGETYRRSVTLEESVKDVRSNLRDQLLQATTDAQTNPNMYTQNRLMQVKYQIMQQEQLLMSQAQAQLGQPYAQMLSANRLGYLPSTDFSQFAQPYQMVQADITSMLNPNSLLTGSNYSALGSIGALGTLGTIPADFFQPRTGLGTNTPLSFASPNFQSTFAPLGRPLPATSLTTGQINPGLNTTFVPTPLPQLQLGTAPSF